MITPMNEEQATKLILAVRELHRMVDGWGWMIWVQLIVIFAWLPSRGAK